MDLLTAKAKAWLALILVVLLAAAFVGYGGWRANKATTAESQRWQLAVDKMKTTAATKLANETRQVLDLERRLSALDKRLERESHEHETIAAIYEKRLAGAAAGNGGRLRDPNAAGCRGGGGGPAPQAVAAANGGAVDDAGAGGVLSVQLSDLLRARLRRADDINTAYIACRRHAIESEQILNGEQSSPP